MEAYERANIMKIQAYDWAISYECQIQEILKESYKMGNGKKKEEMRTEEVDGGSKRRC